MCVCGVCVCVCVYAPRMHLMRFAYVLQCMRCVPRTHAYKLMERVVRPSRWQRPRERAYWTGVIKQQDNDGDLRGPTANGLTCRFLHGQHARRRERKVERLRARFINLARATRTQMRLGWTWLDSTRRGTTMRPGALTRWRPLHTKGLFILCKICDDISIELYEWDWKMRLEYFSRIITTNNFSEISFLRSVNNPLFIIQIKIQIKIALYKLKKIIFEKERSYLILMSKIYNIFFVYIYYM